jgi:lanthionine synthetase-like protein
MLFSPSEHEAITSAAWDEDTVRAAVRAIVAETERAFDPSSLWPMHPRDIDYGGIDVYMTHGVWSGAAGVLWALHHLAAEGAVELERDYAPVAAGLDEDYRRVAGGEAPAVPGLLVGEAGILLAAELIAPDPARADRLLDVVRSNADNETHELMWGSPGTMLVADAMNERTGDERWSAAWSESADRLLERLQWHEEFGCHLWVQHLYGTVSSYVGSGHGFAGNVAALARRLRGAQRAELVEQVTQTVATLASREDGLANWRPEADGDLADRHGAIRVQWCHGAPGIVTSLAGIGDASGLDDLLEAGAHLTWTAGPLRKGAGLCHGTAGNGYALLAMHARTGEPVWLERARAFAMHALGQLGRERGDHGRGRFSLWTGDLGVAVYAWHCIDGAAAFPTLGLW